jgi:demethylmenaquinone methyltransferase/2-methoxy-6-polyprenyl-1,4-benzoquinol methylase
MAQEGSARAGFFKGDRLELGLRYAYRPDYVPLLMNYLGAKPHSRILEVGTGTAFLARLLARELDDVQVTGLDTDADMLELAGKMVEREGLARQITFVQGDTIQLPFPDNSFDLATSQRLL